jgi:hypothetical protein
VHLRWASLFLASPRKSNQKECDPDTAVYRYAINTLLPANSLQVGLTRHPVAADLKWPSMAIFPTNYSLQSAATTGITAQCPSVIAPYGSMFDFVFSVLQRSCGLPPIAAVEFAESATFGKFE